MTSMYAAATPVAARAMAPTRPPGREFEPGRDDDERPGEHCACADADFGPQDAGLGGEHEQQDDADERDCDACDGENLADPIRVARWPGLSAVPAVASSAAAGPWQAGAAEEAVARTQRRGAHRADGAAECTWEAAPDAVRVVARLGVGSAGGPARSGRPKPSRTARTSRRSSPRVGKRRRHAVRSLRHRRNGRMPGG